MRRLFTIIGLSATVAACVSTGGEAPGATNPAAERGQRFAQRACAGCHAVEPSGESRNPTAPNFASLRMRYTSPQLERRFAAISEHGHYEMPPIYILPDEGRDLAAYIESLGPRQAP